MVCRSINCEDGRFGLAGNCRAVELGKEIMAYAPFAEHDLETFQGDFRVVLLKHLVPLQPEAWSPGVLEIKRRETAQNVRNRPCFAACMANWEEMFGGTAAFRVLFGDLPGRAFSEDLR